jgi:hypothetical protein
MAYSRPDGPEAFATPDGGFVLVITRYGLTYHRAVPSHGLVTQAEAAAILRPVVSRVAVFKWVKDGKLKDDKVNGVSMIRLSRLREFAAKHGYGLAGPDKS